VDFVNPGAAGINALSSHVVISC